MAPDPVKHAGQTKAGTGLLEPVPPAADVAAGPISKIEMVYRKSCDYLDLVSGSDLTAAAKQQILEKTLSNFDDYFNRGFLHYRKSVAEAEDFAAIEWTGQGSIIEDLMGRKVIDCRGGFGVFNMWVRHHQMIHAGPALLAR